MNLYYLCANLYFVKKQNDTFIIQLRIHNGTYPQ